MENFLSDINDVKKHLNTVSKPDLIQKMKLQEQKLIDLYTREYSDVPNDDPVKLELLKILMTYKINPYKNAIKTG